MKISSGSRTQASKKGIIPLEWLYRIAISFNCSLDYLVTGQENMQYLQSLLEKKKISAEKEIAKVLELDDTLRQKLISLKIPVPENIGAFVEVSLFLKKHNIDLLTIMQGKVITIPSQDLQPVYSAFNDVMTSDHEGVKLALTQNTFMFQETVANAKKVAKLEYDIKEIKRVLNQRETDFKTQGLKREGDLQLGEK